jgi:NAD dependent epimerase/dehydratase
MELKNKNSVVTGADGFIGSHLVESLLEMGVNVKAFCCYNSFNSLGWIDTFAKEKQEKIEVFTGDIRDPNEVRTALNGADIVFHLAALISIPHSYRSPDSYIDTNIKGTLNVLQASRAQNIKKILVTSTSEVYGTALYVPIDEKHPLQGQSPYSATKIGADKIAESFYRSFDLPVTIVRPFNTYGPRQSIRAVIPTIITQVLSDRKEIKLGNLESRRDFNFVNDICNGYIEIAKSDKTIGEEINIASGIDISIGEIAEKIFLVLGVERDVRILTDQERVRPKKSEVMRLLGSNEKLRSLTSWNPKYDMEKGIRDTVNWFKSNIERYKTNIYGI